MRSWYNPSSFYDWGDVGPDGAWTGSMRMVRDGVQCHAQLAITEDYMKAKLLEVVPYNLQVWELQKFPKKLM